MSGSKQALAHGRVEAVLHRLTAGEGRPLLLLHELGGRASGWPEPWRGWPGPVYALDFSGHGESGRVAGGGYYPEFFLAEADLALEALGEETCVVGAGVGAYVALLLAGARADRVPAALLLPGRGLAGGGSEPDNASPANDLEAWRAALAERAADYEMGTDPWVAHCERDLRPLDYAADFARTAHRLLFDAGVDGRDDAPGWWREARGVARAETAPASVEEALARLAVAGA